MLIYRYINEDGELLDELFLKSYDEEEEINGQDLYKKVKL